MVGTQVGAYRILSQLGEGGMGSVWLAEHTMLGRKAALKMLHTEYSRHEDIVARFFNEARAATAISDPGIVQIFDFGHHTDGAAYIVMELLDGETLSARLTKLRRLPVANALRIIRQVASSLGAAHACGIVHRDLKPENIFLVRDPEVAGGERPKILDFGIAKLVGDSSVKTQTSAVMGTPLFMSPEQCRGAGLVDQRSDIYSLGCVLYMLVVGIPPFLAQGAGDLIAMHLREPPPHATAKVSTIPPSVDELIIRCLAKEPSRRPASGSELAAMIGDILAALPADGARMTPVPAPAPAGVVGSLTTLSSAAGVSLQSVAPARPSKRKWFAIAGAGAVLVTGVVIAIAVSGSSESPSPPAPDKPSVAPPPSAPTAAAAPAGPAPRSEPDPSTHVVVEMKDVLAHFVAWSKTHSGAPCPDATAIGARSVDPWGHPIQVTCTDQPANQMVGVIFAGPDGFMNTSDDISSWLLGHDVTVVVQGARWKTIAQVEPTKPKQSGKATIPPKTVPSAQEPKRNVPVTDANSTKPTEEVELDENGMPKKR